MIGDSMEQRAYRIVFNGMPTDGGKESLSAIMWDCYHDGNGYTCGEIEFDDEDEAYKTFYELSKIVINPDCMKTGDLELLDRDEYGIPHKIRDVEFWRRN